MSIDDIATVCRTKTNNIIYLLISIYKNGTEIFSIKYLSLLLIIVTTELRMGVYRWSVL